MEQKRFDQITKIVTSHAKEWRYRGYCDAQACACSGCLGHGYFEGETAYGFPMPTPEEFNEWAFHTALQELGDARELLEELISLKQQKKIPTLSEYRERLELIDKTRNWLCRTKIE